MSKRPNLAALANAAGSVRVPQQELQPRAAQDGPREATPRTAQGRAVPPSRVGDKPITAFYPEEVRIQLKMLAAEKGRSMESMMAEALNDLFAKYGKAEIAPVTGKSGA